MAPPVGGQGWRGDYEVGKPLVTVPERGRLNHSAGAVLRPARAPPSRERPLLSENELLTRERDLFRIKQQHLEDEARRLDRVIAEMEQQIDEYNHHASTLPSARFKRGGNLLKRSELLLSPALAEAESHRVTKRLVSLRDKLQLVTSKHDEQLAECKKLRGQVDDARRLKLHQTSSINYATSINERVGISISSKIVAAQRAYAEQETLGSRALEVQASSAAADEEHAAALARLAADEHALEEVEAERERELAALEQDVHAAMVSAKAEEERRAAEQAEYKAIVDRRARYQDGLDEVVSTLRVKSVDELMSAHTMTASKILSLWDKHAEQEAELEKLDGELRELNTELMVFEEQRLQLEETAARAAEDDAAMVAGAAERGSAARRSAHAPMTPAASRILAELRLSDRLAQKEALSKQVCAMVEDLARSIPQAWKALSTSDEAAEVQCGQHNVIQVLAAVEAVAAQRVLALRREAARQIESSADHAGAGRKAIQVAEKADGQLLGEGSADLLGADGALGGSEEDAGAEGGKLEESAAEGGARGARRAHVISISPPTMEGIITRERVDELAVFVGYGEARFGRRSLRSELLAQIKAGVSEQREKMREEAILVQIGEKKAEATSRLEVDAGSRDRAIEQWLRRHQKEEVVAAYEQQPQPLPQPAAHQQPGEVRLPRSPGGASSSAGSPARRAQGSPIPVSPLASDTLTRRARSPLSSAAQRTPRLCSSRLQTHSCARPSIRRFAAAQPPAAPRQWPHCATARAGLSRWTPQTSWSGSTCRAQQTCSPLPRSPARVARMGAASARRARPCCCRGATRRLRSMRSRLRQCTSR